MAIRILNEVLLLSCVLGFAMGIVLAAQPCSKAERWRGVSLYSAGF
jgi:hypothetical protein